MRDLKQRHANVMLNTIVMFLCLISSSLCYGKDVKSKDKQLVDSMESWIEKSIQESSIINPSALSRKKIKTPPQHYTLREAIKQAQKKYPGTVLSASRDTNPDSTLIYRVKILSADGIVKIVDIPGLKVMTSEPEIKKEKQED